MCPPGYGFGTSLLGGGQDRGNVEIGIFGRRQSNADRLVGPVHMEASAPASEKLATVW